MDIINKYINHINLSFENAENYKSKLCNEILFMEGMSGIKTRHFYNNLLSIDDSRYLEIGTWKGSSVCSAMYRNNASVICIDNFSQFLFEKQQFYANFLKYKKGNDATFIYFDCFLLDSSILPKRNIFMYDGEHSYNSHFKVLHNYYNCLDDIFIYVVDDWNWLDVRNGTYDSIKNLNLTILYEKEIRLTNDNTTTPNDKLYETWWNGIYVAILKKNNIFSFNINYGNTITDLCNIGKKYDTDKSSQRINITNERHCHPYTIFYDTLFSNKKNDYINIAELGILEGSSLLMWQEYFTNANIYGFDYDYNYINNFKNKYNNDRITLNYINVKDENNIKNVFNDICLDNLLYDIIIEDTTHLFNDQINVILNTYNYLKPGGIMIIEDIFKAYNENDYLTKLLPILNEFQDYYFITMDHVNKYSLGWDNDKLLVLVKAGGPPIFNNNNKITIITPSYRPENIIKLKDSIDFNYVHEWIIVYDKTKIEEGFKQFNIKNKDSECDKDNDELKISEYVYSDGGICGNSQRNYALQNIKNENTFLYFLDDDNIMHPHFFKLINFLQKGKIYTFNNCNNLKGNLIKVGKIDTAMFLIDNNLCKNIFWKLEYYDADGRYIEECYNKNKNAHIYVDNDLSYYNKLLIGI